MPPELLMPASTSSCLRDSMPACCAAGEFERPSIGLVCKKTSRQKHSQAIKSMTHVVLVRHGESVWNCEGRLQGQSPADPHLTERGRRQAAAVRAVLSSATHLDCRAATGAACLLLPLQVASILRPQQIDAIYSSTLARALETAEIVAEAVGVPVRPCQWPHLVTSQLKCALQHTMLSVSSDHCRQQASREKFGHSARPHFAGGSTAAASCLCCFTEAWSRCHSGGASVSWVHICMLDC